jgi:UDP-glucose 4-epimerase
MAANGTALITGGAGFIGSHVADRLLADGWRVVAFDNFAIGRRSNVAHLEHDERFVLLEGDITDRPRLAAMVKEHGIQTVFHLAAVHYIPFCNANPFEALRINLLGTQAVIDAAIGGSAQRIVFASTSDVYATKDTPFVESDAVDPYTVYGTTKMASERMLQIAVKAHPGLSVSVARLFNVYGPRETNPHVLPEVLDQLRDGSAVVRLGNLWPRRDFVFVEDVADALVTLTRSPKPFDVFNVGSGVAYSIGDAVGVIAGLVARPIDAVADPERTRAVERGCLHADTSKIARELGWRPRWTFRDGMHRWLSAERLLDLAAIPPRG